eukprot:TRINITY_DN11918_c0_g1_i1.p1 TRINITY_DN11918_c0_g1~~TRINITY_DN11918_c0_g1_i1.p1  ORF type:complete len:687 (+),score=169.87 TRINITY_DN11918_c0_g1_i1:46-2106(+)
MAALSPQATGWRSPRGAPRSPRSPKRPRQGTKRGGGIDLVRLAGQLRGCAVLLHADLSKDARESAAAAAKGYEDAAAVIVAASETLHSALVQLGDTLNKPPDAASGKAAPTSPASPKHLSPRSPVYAGVAADAAKPAGGGARPAATEATLRAACLEAAQSAFGQRASAVAPQKGSPGRQVEKQKRRQKMRGLSRPHAPAASESPQRAEKRRKSPDPTRIIKAASKAPKEEVAQPPRGAMLHVLANLDALAEAARKQRLAKQQQPHTVDFLAVLPPVERPISHGTLTPRPPLHKAALPNHLHGDVRSWAMRTPTPTRSSPNPPVERAHPPTQRTEPPTQAADAPAPQAPRAPRRSTRKIDPTVSRGTQTMPDVTRSSRLVCKSTLTDTCKLRERGVQTRAAVRHVRVQAIADGQAENKDEEEEERRPSLSVGSEAGPLIGPVPPHACTKHRQVASQTCRDASSVCCQTEETRMWQMNLRFRHTEFQQLCKEVIRAQGDVATMHHIADRITELRGRRVDANLRTVVGHLRIRRVAVALAQLKAVQEALPHQILPSSQVPDTLPSGADALAGYHNMLDSEQNEFHSAFANRIKVRILKDATKLETEAVAESSARARAITDEMCMLRDTAAGLIPAAPLLPAQSRPAVCPAPLPHLPRAPAKVVRPNPMLAERWRVQPLLVQLEALKHSH